MTVTLELEVGGFWQQLVTDTQLVCDNTGHGRLRVFGDLPLTVARDLPSYDQSEIYLQATVIDGRDRVIEGAPLLMELLVQ